MTLKGFPKSPNASASLPRALELGADVIKIAARVTSLAEALELARLGEDLDKAGVAFVPVPMGPAGVFARILANKLGAAFTYASARGAPATGPAQVSLDDMFVALSIPIDRTAYRDLRNFGHAGAREPLARHAQCLLRRLGKDAVYVPFQEERLDDFVRSAKAPRRVRALDNTSFQKEPSCRISTRSTRAHRRSGLSIPLSCETACGPVQHRSRWSAHAVERKRRLEPEECRAGRCRWSGPCGRLCTLDLGVVLRVLARDEARAKELADRFGAASGALDELPELSWDLLVNATPLGSSGESVPVGAIAEGALVFDMVTVPERTPLIATARGFGGGDHYRYRDARGTSCPSSGALDRRASEPRRHGKRGAAWRRRRFPLLTPGALQRDRGRGAEEHRRKKGARGRRRRARLGLLRDDYARRCRKRAHRRSRLRRRIELAAPEPLRRRRLAAGASKSYRRRAQTVTHQ